MARSSMQKKKILLVMKELLEKTDESHPLSMTDLIFMLSNNGISAERKSIYHDIEVLRDFGIDIENKREKPAGYYVASRDFELPELKLLVDAVQCTRFITKKKSEELIKKLENLASKSEAAQLQRQVFVVNRNKTKNENIYYNVDKIHTAISENAKVRFQYYEWTVAKEMRLRREGMFYEISPWALTWDDENYYMIGYDQVSQVVKHYRVDKMVKLEVMKRSREGKELFARFDLASYSQKIFGMFGGEEEEIRLVCKNELAGVMIDRFGKEVCLHPVSEASFAVTIRVNVSQQFFGWLFALGDKVRIEGPVWVIQQFKERMRAVQECYK
ncbi:WYL domain-containing protein [Lachnospiraceae bacterium WCA-9-b2]|uniref:WYL domain-containing protein n=2 Tax=Sporofaciens musculi TaxID=2681861 RepID=A0A7X3MH65_9FIRM|nr:WYL domain-containing protein [Sporofaciens musculi]